MRPDQATRLVAMLLGAFPDARVTAETVQLYALCIADADEDVAARAVTRWMMRQRFFPRISELRDAIEREDGGAPPDLDRAWAEVQAQIRHIGHVGSPTFTHPAIRDAVEAIGWRELCLSEEAGVERAHFQRAYESSRKRTADAGSHRLVEGVFPLVRELMNEGPKQLGEVAKAQLAPSEPRRRR